MNELRDHAYDGIQEYDNPMPRWWTNIFILSVIWSGIYVVGTITDDVPEYTHELDDDLEVAARVEQARLAALPPLDDEMLLAASVDEEAASRGAEVFAFNCASCHNQKGQGLIGPNLTDNAYLYGHSPRATYVVIEEGTKKGMPPWGNILSRNEMTDVLAFVFSVRGTTPDNAKPPEGEPAKDEAAP